MWPSSPQHQHLNLPLTAFPGRSFLPPRLAWACSCLRHSPTTCSRSTLFSLGFSSSLATVKTFPFSRLLTVLYCLQKSGLLQGLPDRLEMLTPQLAANAFWYSLKESFEPKLSLHSYIIGGPNSFCDYVGCYFA